jgi:hypothetical protein
MINRGNISNQDKQLTRTSSIENNRSKLAVINDDQENIKSVKSNDIIDIVYSYTSKEIGEEEELNILKFFQNHPLFKQVTNENLMKVIENLSGYQIKKGSTIYREGEEGFGFYIIKKGRAELIGSKGTKRIVSEGDSFGELALFDKCIRLNTVVALEDMHVYMMEREMYREFTTINFDNIKSCSCHLNSISWIRTLDVNLKNNLAYLTYFQKFEKDETILLNYKNPKLYIIEKGKGEIYCKSQDKFYHSFEYFGESFIFPEIYAEPYNNSSLLAIESTDCFVIEIKYLEEFLGLEYRDKIKTSYLKALLRKSVFFTNEIIDSHMDKLDKIFTFNFYGENKIVYDKNSSKNKKILLILEGSLIDVKYILIS